jgi:phage shock protein E
MKSIGTFILISSSLLLISILFYRVFLRKYRTPQEARDRIDRDLYDVLLDVRTKEEWNEGHHPKAKHLPLDIFVRELPNLVPNKDSRILIVCKRGIRSRAAASMAEDLGYTNVEWVSGLHNGLR